MSKPKWKDYKNQVVEAVWPTKEKRDDGSIGDKARGRMVHYDYFSRKYIFWCMKDKRSFTAPKWQPILPD